VCRLCACGCACSLCWHGMAQFEPLTMVKKTGMFGGEKYMLHGASCASPSACAGGSGVPDSGCRAAQISPLALSVVAEEYGSWFRAHVDKVNTQQLQLGARVVDTEAVTKVMVGKLSALSKSAGTASTRLSVDVQEVTKTVIAVQERMDDLITEAESLREVVVALTNDRNLPTFAEYLQRAEEMKQSESPPIRPT
jgi:hypothetical protein